VRSLAQQQGRKFTPTIPTKERAMSKFRGIKTLQKFAAAHASIHNHFNHDRHLNRRDIFKKNRSAALTEWRQLAA
jgi:putative transposase